MTRRQQFIRRFDGRYGIPEEWEIEKIVAWEQVPDEGTGNWHWEYICIVHEADR